MAIQRYQAESRRLANVLEHRLLEVPWLAGETYSVADIMNIPLVGRPHGGMMTGGIFLAEFVKDGQRWAHLDIAGPSYNAGGPHGYTPKGGTGSAVRTLVQLAEDLADGAV